MTTDGPHSHQADKGSKSTLMSGLRVGLNTNSGRFSSVTCSLKK